MVAFSYIVIYEYWEWINQKCTGKYNIDPSVVHMQKIKKELFH